MTDLLMSLIVMAALLSSFARAGTLTVTSTADDGSDGTLRKAIADAAPGDTINFSLATPATITLANGELLIDKDLTILGPGADALAVDGNAASRVFFVQVGVIATISGLTITNGSTVAGGGGIYNNHSTLTVSSCILRGNSAKDGGGIFSDGTSGTATLTVSASTFSGNSAVFTGGAIESSGNLDTRDIATATISISTSTFSDNSANYHGGAIYNVFSTLSVNASTFSSNSATYSGGGILNAYGPLEIGDTILNRGASGANIANGSGGTVTSHGYNLSDDNGGGFLTGTPDQINTDPLLGPLQDNGGPTFTHALLSGSPAIDQGKRDAIPGFGLNTDQRGFPRPVDFASIPNAPGGDGSDIGAFEVQGTTADLLVSLGADKTSVKQGDTLTYTVTVRNFGPDYARNVLVNDTLSSGTVFVSAQSNVGNFRTPAPGQTGVVTWNLGDLANNNQQAAQIKVTVTIRGKTTITNTATVSSTSSDPNPANNTASLTTTVATGGNKK